MTTTPYLETVKRVLKDGKAYPDRTGVGRIRVFGAMETYDLVDYTLPADTTTQLYLKTLIKEVFAFIKGSNTIQDLGEPFWRQWSPTGEDVELFIKALRDDAEKNANDKMVEMLAKEQTLEAFRSHLGQVVDTIGPMYGVLWRDFPREGKEVLPWVKSVEDIPSDKIARYKERFAAEVLVSGQTNLNTKEVFDRYALGAFCQTFDQLAKVYAELKRDPYSSRHRVTAYHPDLVGFMKVPKDNVLAGKSALPPCHTFFQFMVTKNDQDENELNCMMYMSSSDVMIGRPYNICQYSILTMLLAHCLDFKPGQFTIVSCDTHIYENHLSSQGDLGAHDQVLRTPLPYPKLWINPEKKDLFSMTPDDIRVEGYEFHPKIKYEVAV